MASSTDLNSRFSDFLSSPRELIDFEIKQWLDLSDENHRGLLAKGMIAMENHGGGFILVGYAKGPPPVPDEANRPTDLSDYTSDTMGGILRRYAEPVFNIDVVLLNHPTTGHQFPIIVISGTSSVPVRTKSESPDRKSILLDKYYIRRPGPSSEPVQTGQEWDALIRRCMARQKQEMLDSIRAILDGQPIGRTEPTPDEGANAKKFTEASHDRWLQLASKLPASHPGKLEYGRYWFAAEVVGPKRELTNGDVLDELGKLKRYTGWPPFWVPTKNDIAPYPYSGAVECWLGRNATDSGHADFWRVTPDGLLYLLRGFQEDGLHTERRIEPGSAFDLTLPIWRVAEILLRANHFAEAVSTGSYVLQVRFGWEGLNGRRLVSLDQRRFLWEERVSKQNIYSVEARLAPEAIKETLPETVDKLVRPLYELFDFFRPHAGIAHQEIERMLSRR